MTITAVNRRNLPTVTRYNRYELLRERKRNGNLQARSFGLQCVLNDYVAMPGGVGAHWI